jgi:hypothetical protein
MEISRSAGGDRSPPCQSGESVEVSSGLAPVLVLEVLARSPEWIPCGRLGNGPEHPSSCKPDPVKSAWANSGEFCMDNIEYLEYWTRRCRQKEGKGKKRGREGG